MSDIEQGKICRICYSDSEPFISPCKCSGSIKYVHPECIMRWISMRSVSERKKCENCLGEYKINCEFIPYPLIKYFETIGSICFIIFFMYMTYSIVALFTIMSPIFVSNKFLDSVIISITMTHIMFGSFCAFLFCNKYLTSEDGSSVYFTGDYYIVLTLLLLNCFLCSVIGLGYLFYFSVRSSRFVWYQERGVTLSEEV